MNFLQTIQAVGLPIVSVNADGTDPIFSRPLTDAEVSQYLALKLQFFDPAGYADLQQVASDKQSLKDQYQAALTRLAQIQNATNPTNAQVVAAIQDIAKFESQIMKVLARLI